MSLPGRCFRFNKLPAQVFESAKMKASSPDPKEVHLSHWSSQMTVVFRFNILFSSNLNLEWISPSGYGLDAFLTSPITSFYTESITTYGPHVYSEPADQGQVRISAIGTLTFSTVIVSASFSTFFFCLFVYIEEVTHTKILSRGSPI